jgi:protein SCO1/2
VRFVFVSVDWKHDTPEIAGEFARGFHPSFVGVVADSASLRLLLPAFRAEASYDTLPGGGLAVSHTDYTYLVDDSAHVALSYDFAARPENVARDVRRMIAARGLATR